MAGAYCKYCGNRCFVARELPEGHRCMTLCKVLHHTFHMATCQEGMAHDREATGFDSRTAINPYQREGTL